LPDTATRLLAASDMRAPAEGGVREGDTDDSLPEKDAEAGERGCQRGKFARRANGSPASRRLLLDRSRKDFVAH